MKTMQSRRNFLTRVGQGVLTATLGPGLAAELGLAPVHAEEAVKELDFGEMEPLVRLMQETPVGALQKALAEKLTGGVPLKKLVAAGALANARTFGGEDYVGFHTMMALAPALHIAEELPDKERALPVFKVLYRNTNRIQEAGGRKNEVLKAVESAGAKASAEDLRQKVRSRSPAEAEAAFATLRGLPADELLETVLTAVEENQEVHRTVLPYRAWDLSRLIGMDHAHTLLRQSVRYCVRAESWRAPDWEKPGVVLTKLMEQHHLPAKNAGERQADDAWVLKLSETIFSSTPEDAAAAAAAALAEGFAPAVVGEALSLAANQLVLRDGGRRPQEEQMGKPIGSVHGDSIGVHASDSANAWRNMAAVGSARNACACLILGAWQAAFDRVNRGGDFLNWQPLPLKGHLDSVKSTGAEVLLREAEDAIRANLQARASAIVHRYGQLGYEEKPVFDLLRRFAVSEDGALHAEKYFRTVTEDFRATRPALRWRHLAGLARVTASEFGRPAPGRDEARELLGVKS